MAENLYHLLSFIPATGRFEMPSGLEALATALVRSGKLRINADTTRNFVRLGLTATDQTFTARELTDPALAATTRALLARHVAPAEGEDGVARLRERLLTDLKKTGGVSAEKEMKVARVLVQSADPAVIQLLLAHGSEIFVSYSHDLSDLMAIEHWQTHGTASGMQSTGEGTAVYISAGGDPFFEGEQKHYTTDGFPALARMVVIAGQELGHFADLRHTKQGITGRHSTDAAHMQLRASPPARQARETDMARVRLLAGQAQALGLQKLVNAEQAVAFYHRRLRYSPPWWWHQTRRLLHWTRFTKSCRRAGMNLYFKTYPAHRHGEAFTLFLQDMAVNLAPEAEVYRNPDPLVEEAIATIEAVARVPQQIHKWGVQNVTLAWPGLTRFYHSTVLPACREALDHPLPPQHMTELQQLKAKWRRWRRPRPGYYPDL